MEVLSASGDWSDLLAKIDSSMQNGAVYAVAIEPFRNDMETRGAAPLDFEIDLTAIVEA